MTEESQESAATAIMDQPETTTETHDLLSSDHSGLPADPINPVNPILSDAMTATQIDLGMPVVAESPKPRRGRKTNAQKAEEAKAAELTASATASTAITLTATATPQSAAMPDADFLRVPLISVTSTGPESQPAVILTPIQRIQAALDAVPESDMAKWAIEVLADTIDASSYRKLFRCAAEQRGEAGVLRLLMTMLKYTKPRFHGGLRLASTFAVASSRASGKGIDQGTTMVGNVLQGDWLAYRIQESVDNGTERIA